VAEAERRVSAAEAEVARLVAALADPGLYQGSAGRRAPELARSLEEARRHLEAALAEWAAAAEAAQG
jgi:hypothetical protein